MSANKEKHAILNDALSRFQDYVGLKLHFNSDLIYKGEFRGNLKQEQLMARKDAYLFFQMAEETTRESGKQVLISLFRQNPKAWIGDYLDEDAIEFHKKRMKVISSIKHSFSTDIERLKMFMVDKGIDLKTLLKSDGQSPYIITNYSDIIGGVTDETLALLDRAFKFTKQESIDPLWDQKKFSLSKYGSLIEIDRDFFLKQLDNLIAS